MKALFLVLFMACTAQAQDKPVWRSACTDCGKTNLSSAVFTSGAFSTNGGAYITQYVLFKCKNCKATYSAELPPRFVKKPVAERVFPTNPPPPLPIPAKSPRLKSTAQSPQQVDTATVVASPSMLWMRVFMADTEVGVPDYNSFTNTDIVPASGLTNSFTIVCYTGPMWELVNLTTNTLYVERSTNMLNFNAYPGEGVQLTLTPNSFVQGMLQPGSEFFRARL